MRTIITFLGKRPTLISYSFQGRVIKGEVFAKALRGFVDFDRMLVFTTPEAHTTTWPVLAELNDARIREIPITIGASNEEMWKLFDAVISQINEGETVIFDITHGLRSIPFLAFLFAAYLKTAKQVTIEAIYYGAFELGDEKKDIPAPVIDLSEYVTMLDWITATDQFVQTGNAIRLANLLESREKNAAEALRSVSRAAFLTQPFSLSKEAQKLQAELKKAASSFVHTSQPFTILAEKVVQTFTPFVLPEEISKDVPVPFEAGEELLSREWDLIEWYYSHGQWMQALTLAREFLVDLVTCKVGNEIDLKPENRNMVERGITGVFKIGKKFRDEFGEERLYTESDLNRFGAKFYETHPNAQEIATLFDTFSTLRNQLNHAEHKKDALRFSKLVQKIPQELEKVRQLFHNSNNFYASRQKKAR